MTGSRCSKVSPAFLQKSWDEWMAWAKLGEID